MVTILPISIRTRITSAAFTDIDCARSATLVVSGTETSRLTGSVGFSKACWPAVVEVNLRGLIGCLVLRRPRLPSARCSSPPLSDRPFALRFLGLSSRRPAPFPSSGGTGGGTGISGVEVSIGVVCPPAFAASSTSRCACASASAAAAASCFAFSSASTCACSSRALASSASRAACSASSC